MHDDFIGIIQDRQPDVMRAYGDAAILQTLFGTGKGSGAALMMLIPGVGGSFFCIITGRK